MLAKMATTPEISALNNNPEAVRKRLNRKKLKEKRREDSFTNKYIQLKYPHIYTEIKESYDMFVRKYPSRCDFTKTYFFKKWEKRINMEPSKLYVPHLPILAKRNQMTKSLHKEIPAPSESMNETPPAECMIETPPPESMNETPLPESMNETPPPGCMIETPPPESMNETPPPGCMNETPPPGCMNETPPPGCMNETPPPESMNQTPPPESMNKMPPSGRMNETPPQVEDLCMGMSLDEMNIAAEEIIRSLQSDRDLMDIVENFEFPEGTWDNDLVLPDYVLETDMDW